MPQLAALCRTVTGRQSLLFYVVHPDATTVKIRDAKQKPKRLSPGPP